MSHVHASESGSLRIPSHCTGTRTANGLSHHLLQVRLSPALTPQGKIKQAKPHSLGRRTQPYLLGP